MTVTFSVFSFLQQKLRALENCYNAPRELENGATVGTLVLELGLDLGDVEAAFVNGRAQPLDTVLRDGDRIGLVPPGTPGPHRFLMGIHRQKRQTR